jgi:hypothetical protein
VTICVKYNTGGGGNNNNNNNNNNGGGGGGKFLLKKHKQGFSIHYFIQSHFFFFRRTKLSPLRLFHSTPLIYVIFFGLGRNFTMHSSYQPNKNINGFLYFSLRL